MSQLFLASFKRQNQTDEAERTGAVACAAGMSWGQALATRQSRIPYRVCLGEKNHLPCCQTKAPVANFLVAEGSHSQRGPRWENTAMPGPFSGACLGQGVLWDVWDLVSSQKPRECLAGRGGALAEVASWGQWLPSQPGQAVEAMRSTNQQGWEEFVRVWAFP